MLPGSRLNAFQNARRTYPSVKHPSLHVTVPPHIKRVQMENVCVLKLSVTTTEEIQRHEGGKEIINI